MKTIAVLLLIVLHLSERWKGFYCTGRHSSSETASSYKYEKDSEVLMTENRVSGMRSNEQVDFILGALIPVHFEDPGKAGAKCGVLREDEELEALLFAIDSVNANTTLLPGIQLGYDIRDTCYSQNIGLDEAIDLIITGNDINLESCTASSNVSEITNAPMLGIVGARSSGVSRPVASLTRLFQVPQISPASTYPS